jgi:hypothetical protein
MTFERVARELVVPIFTKSFQEAIAYVNCTLPEY